MCWWRLSRSCGRQGCTSCSYSGFCTGRSHGTRDLGLPQTLPSSHHNQHTSTMQTACEALASPAKGLSTRHSHRRRCESGLPNTTTRDASTKRGTTNHGRSALVQRILGHSKAAVGYSHDTRRTFKLSNCDYYHLQNFTSHQVPSSKGDRIRKFHWIRKLSCHVLQFQNSHVPYRWLRTSYR